MQIKTSSESLYVSYIYFLLEGEGLAMGPVLESVWAHSEGCSNFNACHMEMLSVRNKINCIDGIKVLVHFKRKKNMAELKQVLKCFYEKGGFPQVGLRTVWQGKAPGMRRQKDTLVLHPASHSNTVTGLASCGHHTATLRCMCPNYLGSFCNIPKILSPFQRAKGTWSFHLTHNFPS